MNIEANTPRWFAVYTKHKYEKLVARKISDLDLETYCPLNKVVRQWSDRKKVIEEPLFKSYVFVKSTLKDHSKVRSVDGVINYVYWLGKPASIKDQEIETIKAFLKDHQNVTLERTTANVNDRVRITKGLLLHSEGIVHEVYNKTVKVYLPSLGFQMMALVNKEDMEIIDNAADILV